MPKRYLVLIVSVPSWQSPDACGSSPSGGSASAPAEPETQAPTAEAEASSDEAEEAEETGGSAEIASIMRREIYGRWGGTATEFDVAGGTCKIVKINTTEAEIKSGGEAILDHEHDASVLVAPLKGNGGGATAKECQEAVAIAIG